MGVIKYINHIFLLSMQTSSKHVFQQNDHQALDEFEMVGKIV